MIVQQFDLIPNRPKPSYLPHKKILVIFHAVSLKQHFPPSNDVDDVHNDSFEFPRVTSRDHSVERRRLAHHFQSVYSHQMQRVSARAHVSRGWSTFVGNHTTDDSHSIKICISLYCQFYVPLSSAKWKSTVF